MWMILLIALEKIKYISFFLKSKNLRKHYFASSGKNAIFYVHNSIVFNFTYVNKQISEKMLAFLNNAFYFYEDILKFLFSWYHLRETGGIND